MISNWSKEDLELSIQDAWNLKSDTNDYRQYIDLPRMDSQGLVTINFNPAIRLPHYLRSGRSERKLQQQDAESAAILLNYLNNGYNQLYDYKSYDCEDSSGQDCA